MHTTHIRTTRRVSDLAGDLALLVWAVAWFLLARFLGATLDSVAEPVDRLGTTTSTMADRLDATADSLRHVALIGDQLAAPFPSMAAAMRDMARQLTAQMDSLATTSAWLMPLLFLGPTLLAAGWYIPWRIRRVRETTAARGMLAAGAGLDFFALRALGSSDLTGIARISGNPVRAWRAGDPHAVQALATLELTRLGIGLTGDVQGH